MEKKTVIWLALVAITIVCILRKFWNYFRAVRLAWILPGPKAHPVIGNVLTIIDTDELLQIGRNVSQLYGPLIRAWMFVIPIAVIYEPKHLKAILSNTKSSEKNFFYNVLHTIIGDGLITSTGEKWRKSRKCIQPLFQTHLLENHFDDISKISMQMAHELNGHKSIDICKIINKCVLNILHKTVLGIQLQYQEDTPFRKGELLLLKRVLNPWLLFDSIFQHSDMSKRELKQSTELHQYVNKIIDTKLTERKLKIIKGVCLLDQLIDLLEINVMSRQDVINETLTFLLAGQDSVDSALAFCFYHFAKHQEVQNKVLQEIEEIVQGSPLSVDHINKMDYLEQCIKETLRLYPSLPIIARVLTNDVVLEQYTLPRGTNVLVSPYVTHRLPHLYPNPEKFDPNRFSIENSKKIQPYGFLPFSLGPRNCIGSKFAYLEMKTMIVHLIKNYHISLTKNQTELRLAYRVTLRAKGGIWLDIQPRSKRYVD